MDPASTQPPRDQSTENDELGLLGDLAPADTAPAHGDAPSAADYPDLDDTETAPQAAPPGVRARNLVVSQLPKNVDTQRLRQIFAEFGRLVTALVMMDVASGKSRGFGFVWFESVDDATRAVDTMNGAVLEDGAKPLKVFASHHPDGLSESPTINVLNFPASIGTAGARAMFESFGLLRRFLFAPDMNGARTSGSGATHQATAQITVEFADVIDARGAVNALHGVRSLMHGTVAVNLTLPLVTKYQLPGSRPTPVRNVRTRDNQNSGTHSTPGVNSAGGSAHSTTHLFRGPYVQPGYGSLPGSATGHPFTASQPVVLPPPPPGMMWVSTQPQFQPPAASAMAAGPGGYVPMQPAPMYQPAPGQTIFFTPSPNSSGTSGVAFMPSAYPPGPSQPQHFSPQPPPGMYFASDPNMTFAPPPPPQQQHTVHHGMPPPWMQAQQHGMMMAPEPFNPFAPPVHQQHPMGTQPY